MTPQTMTGKQRYAQTFEREAQTTRKLLHAYPADQAELKPAEKLKSARELGWMLVLNQMVVVAVIDGTLNPGAMPNAPASWSEVLSGFDAAHKDAMKKIEAAPESRLHETIKLPVGPGKLDDVPIQEALWMFLMDTVHHRGQFSVFLRLAGAKVPSIYGPTADEKWF